MRPNPKVKEPIIPCNPPKYFCHRAVGKLEKLDGDITKPFWQTGEWIDDFHDIEGDTLPRPAKYTKVKLLWDEEALYIAAYLEDDQIWANVKNRDEVIFVDNDFEVFLAPQDSSHRYYEYEMNAANVVWDLLMDKPQRDPVHRIMSWDIHGLETAVKIDGELNNPSADNKGWGIEIKMPWFSLRECEEYQVYPTHFAPDLGETWRLDFSRVEWDVYVEDNQYKKVLDPETGRPLPEHNWLWAPTGVIDAHMPEMWGYLIFTEKGEEYPIPAEDEVKWILRKLYYREHAYSVKEGKFTEDVKLLMGDEGDKYNLKAYVTPCMFEGIAEFEGHNWHIRHDGLVWQED